MQILNRKTRDYCDENDGLEKILPKLITNSLLSDEAIEFEASLLIDRLQGKLKRGKSEIEIYRNENKYVGEVNAEG